MKQPQSFRPSAKEAAYLEYKGYGDRISTMGWNEGIDLLEKLREGDYQERDENNYRDLKIGYSPQRTNYWIVDRLFFYPELFKSDIAEDLSYEFKTHISRLFTGSSEKLYRKKIKEVILLMLEEDVRWWMNPDRNEVFLERFSRHYPKSCDGQRRASPVRTTRNASAERPQLKRQIRDDPKRSKERVITIGPVTILIAVMVLIFIVSRCF